MPLPKVLIINQIFDSVSGQGITLTNLFKGWDPDKLAVACGAHTLFLDNIDTSICDNYYQLGSEEFYTIFPFKLIQTKYRSGKISFNKEKMQGLSVKRSKLRVKVIMNYLFPLLRFLGIYPIIHKARLSQKFCMWIKEFNPDVIYTQPFSRDNVSFCFKLQGFLNKPMIFHMMDDWPSIVSNKGFFKNYWKRKIDMELKTLFDKTSVFMSISDFMAQEYKSRYHKDFITFHNPIDVGLWKSSQKKRYILSQQPALLYAGRIGLGIERSLQTIAKAVRQINRELGINMRFLMYTSSVPDWIANYDCVEYKGFMPHDTMPSVLASADILMLPLDFTKESIQFVKYSMPTKATEYMISGTPIIVFAPEGTALVHYVRKYRFAKVVTQNDVEELAQVVKELILDKPFREKLANKAIQIAEEFHDANRVRRDFREIISSLVTNG